MNSTTPPTPSPELTHIGPAGPKMVDVANKPVSTRIAVAEARVPLGPELENLFRQGQTKKGDAVAVAQLAGIQAVKQTAAMIPLCHPLPITSVDVHIHMEPGLARVVTRVETVAQTGVEMEALHGASVAALTLIDMGKSVQRDLAVEHVRLLEKTGGTRGDYRANALNETKPQVHTPTADGGEAHEDWPTFTAAVLTVSDRAHGGVYQDRGGPAVRQWLAEQANNPTTNHAVVPDDPAAIRQQITTWTDDATSPPDLLFTTGGTGLGPRDRTPDVTAELIERPHPGLVELARSATLIHTPLAHLSRAVAGVRRSTLVINLPGSPRGATQWLDALHPVLPHALRMLQG